MTAFAERCVLYATMLSQLRHYFSVLPTLVNRIAMPFCSIDMKRKDFAQSLSIFHVVDSHATIYLKIRSFDSALRYSRSRTATFQPAGR
jgi:hypothetical protein